MGGMKRKLPMKKIEKKESRAVAFSKRRNGLYSKASKLCRLSGAQMAILMTPSSSNSHASFYSFGHSSVDGVVAAFLNDQRSVREDTLGELWWEDEDLAESENPEELRSAIESMSKMLRNLKEVRLDSANQRVHQDDVKIKDLVPHETLNVQSSSAICDALPIDHFNKIAQEQDRIMATGNLDAGYIKQEQLVLDESIDVESLFEGLYETTPEHPEFADEFGDGRCTHGDDEYNMCSNSQGFEDGASEKFG